MPSATRGSALTIAAAVFCIAGCSGVAGESEPTGNARASIVAGVLDAGDPAVVALDVGMGLTMPCTATLIAPRVIVTAAHCVRGLSLTELGVYFGSDMSQGSRMAIIDAVPHPNFNGDTGDVAVITLAEAASAPAVALSAHAFEPQDVGASVRIAGFGLTNERAAGDGLKREATTTLTKWDADFIYTDGYTADTCYGDSGGPVFMTIDGVEYLAAVTSFGTGKCGAELSGATRVDVYRQWLLEYVAMHEGLRADPGNAGLESAKATPDAFPGDEHENGEPGCSVRRFRTHWAPIGSMLCGIALALFARCRRSSIGA